MLLTDLFCRQATNSRAFLRRVLNVLFVGTIFGCCSIAWAQSPGDQKATADKAADVVKGAKKTLEEAGATDTADVADDAAGANADDELQSLLKMAEQDLSQLSQVKVTRPAAPATAPPAPTDAPSLNTVVSTVERKKSTVGKTPAAVYVITNDMIRRSGARSVPEALRMAPGVQVARVNGSNWAVSMRGFNGRFSNKLLVQVDGRSIYSPLFAGVFWDARTVLLEDVQRIEVIRGPGGAVWGANAMNGVINIVSKKASETVGSFFEAGVGEFEQAYSSFRQGYQLNENAHLRFHGQWFERDGFRSSVGQDDWRTHRFGTRLDWDEQSDSFTLQGDYYNSVANNISIYPLPAFPGLQAADNDERATGGNALYRWTRQIDEDSSLQFQTYYDTSERRFQNIGGSFKVQTFDFDFQHTSKPFDNHEVTWGASYRLYQHSLEPIVEFLSLNPSSGTNDIVAGFIQDTITLREDELFLTLGSRLSHNDFTGTEFQPSARLLWAASDTFSTWAAASRGVRTASILSQSGQLLLPQAVPLGGGAVGFSTVSGQNDIRAENVFALEFGMRQTTSEWFSWDLAVFANWYDDLIGTQSSGAPIAVPIGLNFPLQFANSGRAKTAGLELASNLDLTDNWQLRGSYTWLNIDFDGSVLGAADDSPQNQLYLQSSCDLGPNTELDLTWRYVDNLGTVPAYSAVDARLGWRPQESVEFYVVGQNLLDGGHPEFGNSPFGRSVSTEVPRGVFGGVSVRY